MILRKMFFLAVSCAFLSVAAFAQEETPAEDNQEIGIADVYVARAGADGKAGEAANVFATGDVPLFCVITLKSAKAVAVRMHLIELANKSNQPMIKINYQTNGDQTRVSFRFKPEKIWAPGKYRIDVLLDGKVSGSQTFEVQGAKIEKESSPVPKTKLKSSKRAKKT